MLALAIVHKVFDPGTVLRRMADIARRRLVLRLPAGSLGEFSYKYGSNSKCDDVHRTGL